MNGSLYWDSHQSCIRLQIGVGICAVLTAEAVTTGEVDTYLDSVNFGTCLGHEPQLVLYGKQNENDDTLRSCLLRFR